LTSLADRLGDWLRNWPLVCIALRRDSFVPHEWPVRPWLFVPERLVGVLLRRLEKIGGADGMAVVAPRITPLEMVQPWRYSSWNRIGEETKPAAVPESMRA
jgi:hypothetical protein